MVLLANARIVASKPIIPKIMPPYDIRSTPNPNSLKFEVSQSRFAVAGMVSASSVEEASGNQLATALCSIDGVVNVFILPQFLTVTKRPEVGWDEILPKIESLLTAELA